MSLNILLEYWQIVEVNSSMISNAFFKREQNLLSLISSFWINHIHVVLGSGATVKSEISSANNLVTEVKRSSRSWIYTTDNISDPTGAVA